MVIAGAEFGAMTDEEALAGIDYVGVIAGVTPEHKVRLVNVLRKQGQIAAMTGDGVNDAPAVKKADIGIAVGTGTQVTKEAAALILTDDNFSTMVKAVELDRGLYGNLTKYIWYQIGGLLEYSKPAASRWNARHCRPGRPILTRGLTVWLAFEAC